MDEPTAALGVVQRERVLDTIRRVRDRGISVVLISHNMPEVLAVADRVEVMRMGRRVAVYTAASSSVEELVGAMTGALEVSTSPQSDIPNGSASPAASGSTAGAGRTAAADGTAVQDNSEPDGTGRPGTGAADGSGE
jgi:ABC-type sugar transport system ATPase subunit